MNDTPQVAPELRELAARWKTYHSTFELARASLVDGHVVKHTEIMECERCVMCDHAMVPPADPDRILRHLLMFHGYRMDGRQFDNANNYLGRAADAA